MKKDGTVTAMEGTWHVDTGYYSFSDPGTGSDRLRRANDHGPVSQLGPEDLVVVDQPQCSGIVRGFGGQELKCSFIPLLSLAMEKAGLDPFEVLKKNFVKPGGGYLLAGRHLVRLTGASTSPGHGQRRAKHSDGRRNGRVGSTPTAIDGAKRRGIGVGVHGNADIGEDASEAYVQLGYNGTATIFLCVTEHGTGQKSNYAKMAAEVLQIPPENISMTPADSLVTPFEFGPVGSRGTYAIGSAVIKAAEDARKKLLEIRRPNARGMAPEDLDTADGSSFVTES